MEPSNREPRASSLSQWQSLSSSSSEKFSRTQRPPDERLRGAHKNHRAHSKEALAQHSPLASLAAPNSITPLAGRQDQNNSSNRKLLLLLLLSSSSPSCLSLSPQPPEPNRSLHFSSRSLELGKQSYCWRRTICANNNWPTFRPQKQKHLQKQTTRQLNQWKVGGSGGYNRSLTPDGYRRQLLPLASFAFLLLLLFLQLLANCSWAVLAQSSTTTAGRSHVIHVKVGALLEESDHEQANMFIRTIKMINERKDETIRQLLNISNGLNSGGGGGQRVSREQHHLQPHKRHLLSLDKQQRLKIGEIHDEHLQGKENNYQVSSNFGWSSTRYIGDDFESAASAGQKLQNNQPLADSPIIITQEASSGKFSHQQEPSLAAAGSEQPNWKGRQRRDITSQGDQGDELSQTEVVVKLEPMIEFLTDRQSSFEADCKVCQLIESGAHTLVGPTDGASIQHVQSICDNMEIPYFELRPFLGSLTSQGGSTASAASMTVTDLAPPPPPSAATTTLSTTATSSSSSSQFFTIETSHQQQQLATETHVEGGYTTTKLLANRSTNSSLPSNFYWPPAAAQNQTFHTKNSRSAPIFTFHQPHSHHHHHQQQRQPLNDQNQTDFDGDAAEPPTVPQGNSGSGSGKLEDLTLNLYPPAHLLTSAYIDLIYAWNWTSFAIVYEDGSSMIKLQDLFRESSGTWTSKWRIKLFQFNPALATASASSAATTTTTSSGNLDRAIRENSAQSAAIAANGTSGNSHSAPSVDSDKHQSSAADSQQQQQQQSSWTKRKRRAASSFRDLFWQIRDIGEQNIIMDVRTEHLFDALKQAQQVGCMTERYSYLITSLDLHTIDLEDFKYSRTRMTAFSILEVAKSRDLSPSSSSGEQQPEEVQPKQRLTFDEKYLEKLGVHVVQSSDAKRAHAMSHSMNDKQDTSAGNGRQSNNKLRGFKLSPSVVLEKQGSFMEPPGDVYKDWTRREQLMSSPASMSLLPSVDRDSEHKLFEFFLEQQERNLSHVRLSTASAILHDSLILYMLGLNELDPSGSFLSQQQALACSLDSQPWLHGSSLVNYMRRISFTGLTGSISFDQRGLRTDFKLNLMGVAPDVGLIKVGEWHSKGTNGESNGVGYARLGGEDSTLQLNPLGAGQFHTGDGPNEQQQEQAAVNSRTYEEQSKFYESELRRYRKLLEDGVSRVSVPYTKPMNRAGSLMVNEIIYGRLYREQEDQVDTLIISTKLSQPYFMLKETPNKLSGNDQYEGFAVDLIHELSKLVNFKYRWREVADKKYGSKVIVNGTVQWNGMIGEILRGQADLAIVDLTITAQREEAVDFTLPFMNTGISILFKKPTTKVTTLFSFLSPFSSDVWAYVLAAYCGISAILFLVGHLSPYEWADPHPCRHGYADDDQTAVLKNQFSLLNSFWFTIGSLMQQGSDLTPRSMSTRTIAGIWYFFTLIMISSYTANLAAFLTVEKVVYPIENVRDLSQQHEIRYGCVESGSTCTFFQTSQLDTYKRIHENMEKFKTYVKSNDEGQKRVEEGKFAFFMESASIEYIVERNCNLTQIGGLLDSKGYGLATSKKSRLKRPYRTLLSEGILHLQETGMLHILKNRWWKERRGGGTCTDDGKGGGVTELSLANVGGVFVVLLGGLGISFLVAIAEFMWRAKRSGSTRDKMCEEMMSDLKFALACKRSMKPVVRQRSSSGRQDQKPEEASIAASRRLKRKRELFHAANSEPQLNWYNQQQQQQQQMPRQLYNQQSVSLMSQLDQVAAAPAATTTTTATNENATRMMMIDAFAAGGGGGGVRQLQLPAADSYATNDIVVNNNDDGKSCDPILLHAMLTMLMQRQQQQSGAIIANDATLGSEQVVALSRQQQQQFFNQRQQQQAKFYHSLDVRHLTAAAGDNGDYNHHNQQQQPRLRQLLRQQEAPPFMESVDNVATTSQQQRGLADSLDGGNGSNSSNGNSSQSQSQMLMPNGGGGGGNPESCRWLPTAAATSSSSSSAAIKSGDTCTAAAAAAAASEKRRLLLFAQQTIDTVDDSTFLGQQKQHDTLNSQQQQQ